MPTKLSADIRRKREEKGFGLREFAREIGISPSYLSMWESGEITQDPSEQVISAMERALGMNRGFLLASATTGGATMIKEVFEKNSENADMVRTFLDEARKKEMSRKTWEKILAILGK